MFIDSEFDFAGKPRAPIGPKGPIRALLLDDSAFDRKRIKRLSDTLDIDIEFEEVPTIAALSNSLDQSVFDLVLIDYQLPEGDGMSALDLVQSHDENSNAATVMITGNAKTDVAISALRNGFHDFISKDDITPDLFKQAILAAMRKSGVTQRPQYHHMPELNIESLHTAFVSALREFPFKDAIKPFIADELQKAIAEIKDDVTRVENTEVQQILTQFHADEEFKFF